MKIIETPLALTEDWSQCRSPARAQRRYHKGHPQHVTTRPAALRHGDILFVHPTIAAKLRHAKIDDNKLKDL